jgi:hypothetical protein
MSSSISAADQAAVSAANATARAAIAKERQVDSNGNYLITSLRQITAIFDSLSAAAVMLTPSPVRAAVGRPAR